MMKNRKRNVSSSRHLSAILLGKDGVGKSDLESCERQISECNHDLLIAFTVRLLTRRYIGEYSKLEENYSHNLEIDGETVSITVFDTSGVKSERELEDMLLLGDMYIIMYSITDRTSFGECRRLGRFLREHSCGNVDMFIVGNKTDLEHSRDILECEGSLLAKELDCRFYEISVANNFTDVDFVMSDAIKKHIYQKQTDSRPRTSKNKVKENVPKTKSFQSLRRRMSIS